MTTLGKDGGNFAHNPETVFVIKSKRNAPQKTYTTTSQRLNSNGNTLQVPQISRSPISATALHSTQPTPSALSTLSTLLTSQPSPPLVRILVPYRGADPFVELGCSKTTQASTSKLPPASRHTSPLSNEKKPPSAIKLPPTTTMALPDKQTMPQTQSSGAEDRASECRTQHDRKPAPAVSTAVHNPYSKASNAQRKSVRAAHALGQKENRKAPPNHQPPAAARSQRAFNDAGVPRARTHSQRAPLENSRLSLDRDFDAEAHPQIAGRVPLSQPHVATQSQSMSQPHDHLKQRPFKLTQLTDAKLTRTNDEVHQTIDMCPVMKALVDTKRFQRLRRIQQLGPAALVFTCANHTRFEHSLGVAHLARQVARRIQFHQPNLRTTDKDVLCVTLAGLLHDIGHGPGSHLYEQFRSRVNEEIELDPEVRREYERFDDIPKGWTHESASLMMIDAALADLGMAIDYRWEALDKPLKQIGDGVDVHTMKVFGASMFVNASVGSNSVGSRNHNHHRAVDENILTSRDWIFVKECILGGPIPEAKEKLGTTGCIGRMESHKEWLYDIVANKHSGLDVDKLDYFARDKRRAFGVSGNVDIPIINDAIVARAKCSKPSCLRCYPTEPGAPTDTHCMICYPIKHVASALGAFQERFKMHETVYQHKTVKAASAMMCDILRLADTKMLYNGMPISRACADPDSYQRLDDNILALIREDQRPEMKAARDLVERLDRHDIYKFAAERIVDVDDERAKKLWDAPTVEIVRDLLRIRGKHRVPGSSSGAGRGVPTHAGAGRRKVGRADGNDEGVIIQLTKQDILVERVCIHYGNKNKNPLSLLRFVGRATNLNRKSSLDDLPLAEVVDEKDHRSVIPESHMKCAVRVYCRTPEKVDLLRHVCEDWQNQLDEQLGCPDVAARSQDSAATSTASGLKRKSDGGVNAVGGLQITPAPEFDYDLSDDGNSNHGDVSRGVAGYDSESSRGDANIPGRNDDLSMYPIRCTQESDVDGDSDDDGENNNRSSENIDGDATNTPARFKCANENDRKQHATISSKRLKMSPGDESLCSASIASTPTKSSRRGERAMPEESPIPMSSPNFYR